MFGPPPPSFRGALAAVCVEELGGGRGGFAKDGPRRRRRVLGQRPAPRQRVPSLLHLSALLSTDLKGQRLRSLPAYDICPAPSLRGTPVRLQCRHSNLGPWISEACRRSRAPCAGFAARRLTGPFTEGIPRSGAGKAAGVGHLASPVSAIWSPAPFCTPRNSGCGEDVRLGPGRVPAVRPGAAPHMHQLPRP